METDPLFNSTENQALLVVCARKTIRDAAILGIAFDQKTSEKIKGWLSAPATQTS
jgi:hypothetical protein